MSMEMCKGVSLGVPLGMHSHVHIGSKCTHIYTTLKAQMLVCDGLEWVLRSMHVVAVHVCKPACRRAGGTRKAWVVHGA